jgi:uncharacterized coiled-coil DUF342 family protein
MPAAIPETIKSRVIIQWLQGLSRDAIAQDNNISTGAASNIINEWTNAFGKYEADALRELAKSLKNAGLSPAQCAIGFRTMKILSEQGIDGETAEHFISDIYKKCKNLGVTPSKIATCIEDLIKFSNQVPLPEIEGYIDQQTIKKRELDNKLQELRNQISTLQEQKLELEKSLDVVLEQKRKATEEMKSYFDAKQELDKHKISITEDIPKFAKTVKCIAEYGYEPRKVLSEFEDIQYLSDKRRSLEIATDEKEKNFAKLKQQEYSLRHAINLHSENLSVYNELENIGFGSRELRRLIHTILDITNSNGIDHWGAVYKFFNDIETQYDAKLGFESEKERLNLQIKILKEKRENMLQILGASPFTGNLLTKLLQLGLTENDILNVAETYLNLLSRTYSAEDLTKGMIKTIDTMMMMTTTTANHLKTTSNDKLTEVLSKVRQDLSELDFTN